MLTKPNVEESDNILSEIESDYSEQKNSVSSKDSTDAIDKCVPH